MTGQLPLALDIEAERGGALIPNKNAEVRSPVRVSQKDAQIRK